MCCVHTHTYMDIRRYVDTIYCKQHACMTYDPFEVFIILLLQFFFDNSLASPPSLTKTRNFGKTLAKVGQENAGVK